MFDPSPSSFLVSTRAIELSESGIYRETGPSITYSILAFADHGHHVGGFDDRQILGADRGL